MQYTPVLNTGANWQIYNGPGFTGAVDIPKDVWFHLRLEVAGAQAKLYVKDMDTPALVMDDLKSGVQKGQVALYVLTGATYFSNFEIRATPDAPWERHLAADAAGHADEVEPVALATMRSRAISSARSRPPRATPCSGRTWRRSRPASWSSIAIARPRICGSRSRTTSRSASSRSRG